MSADIDAYMNSVSQANRRINYAVLALVVLPLLVLLVAMLASRK